MADGAAGVAALRSSRLLSVTPVALGITAWQATIGFEQTPTLGDTARFGLLLFQIIAYVQLTLVLFFAALSGASSITREKDRRTFILLLITDLRSYEIVLGKFAGSLLQILLLLAGMFPVLAVLLLLGGVAHFSGNPGGTRFACHGNGGRITRSLDGASGETRRSRHWR